MTANTEINSSESFYLTVPSNTPNPSGELNKPQQFTLSTQYTSQLKGKWEVALMQIQFPNTWHNIKKLITVETFISKSDKPIPNFEDLLTEGGEAAYDKFTWLQRFKIKPGYYASVDDVMDSFNERSFYFEMVKNPDSGKLAITLKKEKQSILKQDPNYLTISETGLDLFQLLGFPAKNRAHKIPLEAINLPNLTIHFPALFVYCNFIDHQYVGNERAPLLRFIPITSRVGDYTTIEFQKPYYVTLSTGYINAMSFEVRDDTGDFVNFQYGKVILMLHFRPKIS